MKTLITLTTLLLLSGCTGIPFEAKLQVLDVVNAEITRPEALKVEEEDALDTGTDVQSQ